MVLAVGSDGQFAKLCEVLGRPELARDERFATNAARVANIAALNTLIAGILATDDMAAWSETLAAAGVPAGPINPIPAVFADPQVKHREMLVELPHPVAGTVPQVASPIRYAEAPIEYNRAPPLVGQHTQEVLDELGISAEG